MIKIYHNNQCSKSRQCLTLLHNNTEQVQVIDYLNNPPTEAEIEELLQLLDIAPLDLIRKNEPIWKEFSGKKMSDKELVKLLATYPKLIERPIVIMDNKAIIARPPELIFQWLSMK